MDAKHGYDSATTKTYCGQQVTVATRGMVVGPYKLITCGACKTARPFSCTMCGSDVPHEPWHCPAASPAKDEE